MGSRASEREQDSTMRRTRLFGNTSRTLALAFALTAALASPAAAAMVHEFNFGTTGIQKGQFQKPTGLAVNDTTGDVYVADTNNNRIQRFDAAGNFISMWGLNVDATNPSSGFEVCTAASGDDCQAGTAGGSGGAFNGPVAVGVDDSGGPADGSVYVVDNQSYRVQRFT